MELLQWHEAFRVGINLIDRQHRKLFSLINELIVQTGGKGSIDMTEKVLTSLLDYAENHFAMEEDLLKIHPQFQQHKAAHKSFSDKIAGFVNAFRLGNTTLKPALVGFLVDWLKKHVLNMDKNFFQELGYYADTSEHAGSDQIPFKPMACEKILVVEDSADQRFLLKTILEKECYRVVEASNGSEALEICRNSPEIHIIVTDVRMPGMDGYELVRALRRQQVRYLYIIVVTVLDDKKAVIRALEAGADDFLSKPVLPRELLLRIRGGQQLLRLETQDELIFSMAKLSDYRSPETGLHLERVQQYTLETGMYLARHYPEKGVTKQVATEISRVSPLHDIGKVGISDRILTKPGRLTHEEFEIMKDHARIGGDLISDIYLKTGSPGLRIAFELTMYHHEKWDGTGYPAGLSGTGIPVAARIMALADVYDALTTHRVYKKAFSHEKAKQIILEGREKHFDPDLVDTFIALEETFIKLKHKLADESA